MNPKELLKAGKLSEARNALTEAVRTAPGDMGYRTLLFQALSYLGEWDKAERHLDIIAAQDAKRETGIQVYKNLIQAERERQQVAGREKRPGFFPVAPPYAELYFAALEKIGKKDWEGAAEDFSAIESRQRIRGLLNGEEFTGLKDTDSVLSFFLEVFIFEQYFWVPLDNLAELTITRPKTFLDLLWAVARITTFEGLTADCFVPVLYPESFLSEDERLKLGRMTDWVSYGGPYIRGIGQHVFQAGEKEIAILEMAEVSFHVPYEPAK